MDAMLYTSVSHNLSMGIGTFWFPQFSTQNVAGLSAFHEQPPLVFGIQAVFFKVFGDSMYVERFYTFLTMCVTAIFINLLWKENYRDGQRFKGMGWLPIVLWITIPVCFWSYSNNMHENTMSVFTLLAVLLLYKSFRGGKYQLVLWMFSGGFILLATLSKGLPGFFPIAVPFLYWAIIRKQSFSKTILQTGAITLVPVIIYAVLFYLPESKESLSVYFFQRALHRINEAPTVDHRFYILIRIFMELLPQILLVVLVLFVARTKKIKTHLSGQIRKAIFFISIGLSASLPLMLTLVQRGFYFVPALPFFAIGLAVLIAPVAFDFVERTDKRRKMTLGASAFLLITVIIISFLQTGKTSRDRDLLHDIYLIGKVVPKQTTVSIPPESWNNWSLQCYLMRYFNISLDSDYSRDYLLTDKSIQTDTPVGYKKVEIKTREYNLYRRE